MPKILKNIRNLVGENQIPETIKGMRFRYAYDNSRAIILIL